MIKLHESQKPGISCIAPKWRHRSRMVAEMVWSKGLFYSVYSLEEYGVSAAGVGGRTFRPAMPAARKLRTAILPEMKQPSTLSYPGIPCPISISSTSISPHVSPSIPRSSWSLFNYIPSSTISFYPPLQAPPNHSPPSSTKNANKQASSTPPSISPPLPASSPQAPLTSQSKHTLPTRPSGTATFKIFRDASCANTEKTDLQYHNCYFDRPNGVSAVAFVCDGAAASAAPAGSSSILVVADTPGTSSLGAPAGQSAPASKGAPTTWNPPSSLTSTNPPRKKTDSNGADASSGNEGSETSQKTQMILEVVLPVGAIVVALFAWCFPAGGASMHDLSDR